VLITPFPTLTTGRLVLRRLSDHDQQEIFELRSDERINKYIDRPRPKNIGEAIEFISKINKAINNAESLYWAVCLKDSPRLIGTICLWNFSEDHTVAEIGYELNNAYQGNGYMNEAISSVIQFAFEKISLQRIDAYTQGGNAKSIRLLEKNNFILDLSRTDADHLLNRIYSLKH
jgi:ribosomal-protein-alanine N-acetyltransferase